MAVDKFTGDTCFMSVLCRNRHILSSPSSVSSSSLFLLFSMFRPPPVKRKDEGIGGDRQEYVMQGGSVPFVPFGVCV